MDDGEWRHYWQYPVYGQSFKEILDTYRETAEDGTAMSEGNVVWMDMTRTRFWLEEGEGEQERDT
jgi:hypothetical protein